METIDKPTIFIVGQTAAGKTDMSIKLAKKYGGEIICADSRTVYKNMDIGTAKPTSRERSAVIHYGLDLVEPNETYSAAKFKDYAREKIELIKSKGKIPFIVGGTGLYIDGLLYDFSFSSFDEALRKRLEKTDIDELQKLAKEAGISPKDVSFKNPRHLSGAIARGGVINQPKIKKTTHLILGLDVKKEILDKRIEDRVEKMLSGGLMDEAQELISKYGSEAPGLNAPAYKAFIKYLQNKISYSDAKEEFIKADRQLAKRQKTWFKRNKDIIWVKSFTEADTEVKNFISKFDTMSR
ncbi:tRNA dimethylallyltransferase [Candidatus Saccharibacteria bacterium]|nr:tRNA dimethylallyltransferase [Candidatus Saccharibacteria bacterium]